MISDTSAMAGKLARGRRCWPGLGPKLLAVRRRRLGSALAEAVSVTSLRRQMLLPAKLGAGGRDQRAHAEVACRIRTARTSSSWPSGRIWRTLKKREPDHLAASRRSLADHVLGPHARAEFLRHRRALARSACSFSASGAVRGAISSPNRKVTTTNSDADLEQHPGRHAASTCWTRA